MNLLDDFYCEYYSDSISILSLANYHPKKKCFFLDPELKNTTFFGNLDYLKQFRISKYEDLETIVRKNLINYQNGIMFEPEKFCLSHKEVSKKVYEYISGVN